MSDPGVFSVITKLASVKTLHYQAQIFHPGYVPPTVFPPVVVPVPIQPVDHDLTLIGARSAITTIEDFRGEFIEAGFAVSAFQSNAFQRGNTAVARVSDATGIGSRRTQTLITRGN